MNGKKIERDSMGATYDENGDLHSYDDIPSIVRDDEHETKLWHKHGKLHRELPMPAKIYMLFEHQVKDYYMNGIKLEWIKHIDENSLMVTFYECKRQARLHSKEYYDILFDYFGAEMVNVYSAIECVRIFRMTGHEELSNYIENEYISVKTVLDNQDTGSAAYWLKT